MLKNSVTLLVFLITTALYSVAQVQVIQRPANPFQFEVEDIWNLDLVSPYTQSFQAKAKAVIKSSDGKTVVELQSANFTIKSGYNSLSPTSLGTIRKNYFNNDIQEIEEITGSLPAGSFKLCVQFSCVKQDCDGLNEIPFGYELFDCIDLILNPPTPLLLAYPEDQAKLSITRPVLTWIPPMPIAMSTNLTYSLVLTEMRKGQSKMDAIKRNRPLIFQDNIPTTTLPYPMDMDELEKGKLYSWQVEAWVGRTKVGTSEVWEFEIEEKKEEPENPISFHPKNKKDLDFVIIDARTIKIALDVSFIRSDVTVNCKIINDKREIVLEEEINISEAISDYHTVKIKFDDTIPSGFNSYYEIELHNSLGVKKFLRIKIK